MDKCLWGCMVRLAGRFGPERLGSLLAAVHSVAQQHDLLTCELVNRELAAQGLEDLQMDQAGLQMVLETLGRAGLLSVEPVTVH